MKIPISTPVSAHLASLGFPHHLFTHPGPVESLEQAARERNQLPEQVIRSIVFRLPESTGLFDPFVMVLAAGPDQISWPDLRRHLQVTRVTMASKEEVLERTGYQTGSVSPFGFDPPMRTLVDEKVFLPSEISIGSGLRGTTVILKTSDLRKALERVLPQVEVGCFVSC